MQKTDPPKLVTFDGEARSGKGTIVQRTKDYLRDECGYKVMLIDRGQAFRVLVVAAARAGIDMDRPQEIGTFLTDQGNIAACMRLVKEVYHMAKEERDSLLYTNEVGADSAKIGARPASQAFVRDLTKRWLNDAKNEGYEVVLVDGRSLQHIAEEMHHEELCDYRLGLYFVCDPVVGARRTLGYAAQSYSQLGEDEREEVDAFVGQIIERNERDFHRETERLKPPMQAPTHILPAMPDGVLEGLPLLIIDSSAEMTKEEMSLPVAEFVAKQLA